MTNSKIIFYIYVINLCTKKTKTILFEPKTPVYQTSVSKSEMGRTLGSFFNPTVLPKKK